MSSADVLTIHQKLSLLYLRLKPGQPGCPRFIVVSGDQPTYRMLVRIWRKSYLERKNASESNHASFEGGKVHEWLVPFPGFFHIEKQSLFHLCKEMLHGMGLQELAACSGLSQGHANKILQHSHARNNRAVLFSICAAMMVHCIDLLLTECPDLKDAISMVSSMSESEERASEDQTRSRLMKYTTELVTQKTIRIRSLCRARVSSFFSQNPNDRHLMNTILLLCLLPTVGFHVLSRTGHTDVVDSFWLQLNTVLHTSGHLKYQELYLFYGFFRSIMPRTTFKELFTRKPGAMVARVPRFTAGLASPIPGCPYDEREHTYVHLDEALEMLIIRHVKGLNTIMLPFLESYKAWLLAVCKARNIARTVTAASRSFGRIRNDEHSLAPGLLLGGYDCSAVQCSSVRSMVELMRSKGFLSLEHRQSEMLRNAFSEGQEELPNMDVQKRILEINNLGRKSAEIHASAMFPDIFGGLSKEDCVKFFGGKRLKGEWTKKLQIPTVGAVLEKEKSKSAVRLDNPRRACTERMLLVSKLITNLMIAKEAALKGGDTEGAEHATKRFNRLHDFRSLLSPFADAYRSSNLDVRHGNKSTFLTSLRKLALGEHQGVESVSRQASNKGTYYYYDFAMPEYASVMIDIMNHVWTRGTDGRRGNTMFNVCVMKMKHLLCPWFSGRRSRSMRKLHLHIDDPSLLIPQKRGEQERRDSTRTVTNETVSDAHVLQSPSELPRIGFNSPVNVPWSSLMNCRERRDAICSLHLFCGAIASMELADEHNLHITTFLHEGCFSIPDSCVGAKVGDLAPQLAERCEDCDTPRKGEVIL